MLNVTKKATAVLLIFFLCFSLSFCAYEQRVDFSECIRRMNKHCSAYEIIIEESFFSGDEWFCFVDATGESDVLITGTEDEGRLLTRLTVSAVKNDSDEQQAAFLSFCEAAVDAFCENADKEKILADSHIYDENVLFSENAFFNENSRFRTSFYTAAMGCTLVIEIIR